jgi:phage replication-related protein YjqB (UPF0714/DUF867 family)
VAAPHGGGIEPGTTEIADAIADEDHAFYSFIGLKVKGNGRLHLTSRTFDETRWLQLAGSSETVLTLHGCKGSEPVAYVGGRDEDLKAKLKEALQRAGFATGSHPRLPGMHPRNICNHGRLGKGAQIELSHGLRRSMFRDLTRREKEQTTRRFREFVRAVRRALSSP